MPAGNVAARWDAWKRQLANVPGPLMPGGVDLAPFPQRPLAISVAIFVDGGWLDITPDVYGGDRATIEITRGRSSEATDVEPSRATMQLNNRDGRYSPRNPTSVLYGKIGRNTPIR